MGSASEGSVTASQIKAGLESIHSNDSILLLKISDYGCSGLTGPEFPENDVDEDRFGNFIKLCRLDLFSGKDEAAGGSFGLGKAVYWRFSRLQTVLFNSVLNTDDAVDGQTLNRVLGVNQGVLHTFNDKRYVGRGYFGLEDDQGDVASIWHPDGIDAMMLRRDDVRTGTTALMVGFYDPDSPERGLSGGEQLVSLANDLRGGIEESFWPLIARKRLRVRIKVDDDGEVLFDEEVDPRQTFTELVDALGKFDRDEQDDDLTEPFTTVVRDIPIPVPARVDESPHEAFDHVAKLVVTCPTPNMTTLKTESVYSGSQRWSSRLSGASLRERPTTLSSSLAPRSILKTLRRRPPGRRLLEVLGAARTRQMDPRIRKAQVEPNKLDCPVPGALESKPGVN